MAATPFSPGTVEEASEYSEEKRPVKWRASLPAWLSVAGGTALIAWHASRYGGWLVDDAAITFSYARNLSEGLGPVVQPGAAPVEGYSDPTWLALLILGRLAGLFDHGTIFGLPDYIVFPKALALVCCAGILVAGHLAARKVTERAWAVTALFGVGLAAVPSFVIWCFSGLENSLYALVVVALAVLLFHAVLNQRLLSVRVALGAGGLASLAALTRPDGLIYGGAYIVLVLIWLRRSTIGPSLRHIALSFFAFVFPTGAYICWRYFEFGRLVSNTTVTKKQGVPGLESLARPGELVRLCRCARRAGSRRRCRARAVPGGSLAARARRAARAARARCGRLCRAGNRLDGEYRFATPVWALGALVGTLAGAEALRQFGPRARVLLAVALTVTMIPSAVSFADQTERFRVAPTFPACAVADRYGRVFNSYADIVGARQASLLMADLGGSSMTSRLHLVDLGGLADSKIADYIHADNSAGLRDYIFDEVKPTFITLHIYDNSVHSIAADQRLSRDYVQIFASLAPDGSPGGDWARRDAVASPAVLNQLLAYAQRNTARVDRAMNMPALTAPGWTQKCGPVLRPGQTQLSLP